MFQIKSGFIGNFKIGDNICHNLEILKILYRVFNHGNETTQKFLCKPITVLLVSIAEALIYDLHDRIQTFTTEGVPGLSKKCLAYIRQTKLRDFEKHIASAKKHELFGTNEKFYDRLDELRKLRNRIHIQNKKGEFEPDEGNAFSLERKLQAEKAVEFLMRHSWSHYKRPDDCHRVADFNLHWERHYKFLIKRR